MKRIIHRISQRQIYWLCFFFFMLWQGILVLRYYGWYAFDEFYHVSSSNPAFDAVSLYNRAPYLNKTIGFLTSVLGHSYYTYKLIPFVLSMISMAVILYLLDQLTDHTYPAILATLLMSGHALLVFNHLYIRMYVWDEAVIAILALILYQLPQIRSLWIRLLIHLLYWITASIWYFLQTSEESALSVFAVGAAAWLIQQIGYPAICRIKEKRILLPILAAIFFSLLLAEILIICLRRQMIPIPHALSFLKGTIIKNYYPSNPYFTKYFLKNGALFTVGLFGYGYLLAKKDIKKETLGIFTLAFLPFLAYNMFFFDSGPYRSYASFLPMALLIATLWLDSFSARRFYYLAAGTAVAATILFSYWDLDIIKFYKVPYIPNETNLNDYGSLVSQAQAEIEKGRKCIALWSNDHQMASFDLDTVYSFALLDSGNHPYDYGDEDLLAILDFFETTDQPYIFLIGTHCDWKLDAITPEFLSTLLNTYPYEQYETRAFLFYIN